MPLAPHAHGQDVVGKIGRLTPGRRERHVEPNELLVAEHLDPGTSIRVRPHRVVDAREVHRELAAAFF